MQKVHSYFFCWHNVQLKNHSSRNQTNKSDTSFPKDITHLPAAPFIQQMQIPLWPWSYWNLSHPSLGEGGVTTLDESTVYCRAIERRHTFTPSNRLLLNRRRCCPLRLENIDFDQCWVAPDFSEGLNLKKIKKISKMLMSSSHAKEWQNLVQSWAGLKGALWVLCTCWQFDRQSKWIS